MNKQRVCILGASDKPDRFAYKAMKLLEQHGHELVLVNPGVPEIEGQTVVPTLPEVEGAVDTLTVYLKAETTTRLIHEIIELKPGRVIFNPSTKNSRLMLALEDADIPWIEACTLVLLKTEQF
jgi:uncharacterized protein